MADLTPRDTGPGSSPRTDGIPENPNPEDTPGLDAGGGVRPGDTPPTEGSMSEAAENRRRTPNQGPVSPSRKPQIIALIALAIIVLGVIGYGIANIIAYVTK
jgi:hypothetical protein